MKYVIYRQDGYFGGPYVEFADGRRIPVEGEIERLLTRLYVRGNVGGRRLEDISDVEDLAALLERHCQEMAGDFASLATRVRPTLLGVAERARQ